MSRKLLPLKGWKAGSHRLFVRTRFAGVNVGLQMVTPAKNGGVYEIVCALCPSEMLDWVSYAHIARFGELVTNQRQLSEHCITIYPSKQTLVEK